MSLLSAERRRKLARYCGQPRCHSYYGNAAVFESECRMCMARLLAIDAALCEMKDVQGMQERLASLEKVLTTITQEVKQLPRSTFVRQEHYRKWWALR